MARKVPENISRQTLRRAYKVAKNARSIEMDLEARWTSSGDFLFFLLNNNEGDLAIIYCAPNCYLVEYDDDDGTNYFMVKNIRHWLFKLRSLGFYNCEFHQND